MVLQDRKKDTGTGEEGSEYKSEENKKDWKFTTTGAHRVRTGIRVR